MASPYEPPPTHQQPPPGLPGNYLGEQAPYVPNQDERTMGMLIHLLSLLTGLVGPLVLWLVKKDESHFINHHGKEALNFIITTFIIAIPMMVLVVVTFGLGFILFFPWVVMIYVFDILACIKAYRGEWHRIPLTIRLIQ